MPIGSLNPFPFKIGGGRTPTQVTYQVLRSAVGEGGSAKDDRGIDGLWRRSRAKGLAAGDSAIRRALLQAFPNLATDLIPTYERQFGLLASPDATDEERRKAIVEAWTARTSGTTPALEQTLSSIDSRLSVVAQEWSMAISTNRGRAFESHDNNIEGPAFGGLRTYSRVPAYATAYSRTVLFSVVYATALTIYDAEIAMRARRILRTMSAPWVALRLVTAKQFTPGTSVLGITGLSHQ